MTYKKCACGDVNILGAETVKVGEWTHHLFGVCHRTEPTGINSVDVRSNVDSIIKEFVPRSADLPYKDLMTEYEYVQKENVQVPKDSYSDVVVQIEAPLIVDDEAHIWYSYVPHPIHPGMVRIECRCGWVTNSMMVFESMQAATRKHQAEMEGRDENPKG